MITIVQQMFYFSNEIDLPYFGCKCKKNYYFY